MTGSRDVDPFVTPPREVRLGPDEIHVWRIALDAPAEPLERLRELLSADERARADRFMFDRDRERFTIAHAMLRRTLASYLDADPAAIGFASGPYGKPCLATPSAPEQSGRLEFNLSHSGDHALIAVSRDRDVGVDIEHIRSVRDLEGLSAEVLTPAEREVLFKEAEPQRPFFAFWARKEALIKAIGKGLSLPPAQLTAIGPPAYPGTPPLGPIVPDAYGRWYLWDLAAAQDYAAALATNEPVENIMLFSA